MCSALCSAWFRGGPPPRHWVATLPNDYRGGASLGQDTVTASVDAWFRGDPPPRPDRILDYSTPPTGCTFFVPALPVLDGLDD